MFLKPAVKDAGSYSLKTDVRVLLKDETLLTSVMKKQHKVNHALVNWLKCAVFKLTFQFPSCFYRKMPRGVSTSEQGEGRRTLIG